MDAFRANSSKKTDGTGADPTTYRHLCAMLSANEPATQLRIALHDPATIQEVFRLAGRERLLPALYEAVIRRFSADISKIYLNILTAEYRRNRERNAVIGQALRQVGLASAALGFDIVPLKGSCWVLEDVEGVAAWRWMRDIDILVEADRLAMMSNLLGELGYVAVPPRHPFWDLLYPRSEYSLSLRRRGDIPVPVEVHRHAGWRPNILPTDLAFAERKAVAPGLALAPSWFAAFHAILHWQFQDGGRLQLTSQLRPALEVARYLMRDDIDFDRLAVHAERCGRRAEVEIAVAFAVELFGASAPANLAPTARAREHVARCLAIRESAARSWIAQQSGRMVAMWTCKRTAYALDIKNAGPLRRGVTLWSLRLLRLPLIALCGLYVVGCGALKITLEALARSTLA